VLLKLAHALLDPWLMSCSCRMLELLTMECKCNLPGGRVLSLAEALQECHGRSDQCS